MRDVAKTAIIEAVCAVISEGVSLAADLIRRRAGIWRCPECGKSQCKSSDSTANDAKSDDSK